MPRSLQRPHRRQHVGRAEADAQQALLPADVLRAGRRLDQLQVELVARALEQRALGQHAEVLAVAAAREKPNSVLVEVQPVARCDRRGSSARRRTSAGPASAGGLRIGAGERHEVDVVDREVPVAVDEVDEAVADAVDARDVELHGRGARRHLPGAELERVLVAPRRRRARAAPWRRERRRGRRVALVRVDDQVHRRPGGRASPRASGGARPRRSPSSAAARRRPAAARWRTR